MFKRQQNESPYGKSLTVNERVFFGLMFKRQHSQSPYGKSVTVTERVLLVLCLKDITMNRFTVEV